MRVAFHQKQRTQVDLQNRSRLERRATVRRYQSDHWRSFVAEAREKKNAILALAGLLAEIDDWNEQPTEDIVIEAVLLFSDIVEAAKQGAEKLGAMSQTRNSLLSLQLAVVLHTEKGISK